jgi:hypothetical protein
MDISKTTTNKGLEILEQSLQLDTLNVAKKLDVDIEKNIPPGKMFEQLIQNTALKYNDKVVILIDEYDRPYTDFVNDPKMANDIREILRNYYVQLKANDEYIKFVFITGISKFAKFGVFSTMNNLDDISMSAAYAEMCGYTWKEIEDNFPDYLTETANSMQTTVLELKEKMRYYYNGFSFDAKVKLYNPFSTLKFFKEKTFANFWISSGTPKSLADYLKTKNLTVEQFRNLPISDDFARSPGDVDTTPPEGFLYQTGYLTLRPGNSDELSLDYPNIEVLNSMSKLIVQNILEDKNEDFTQCRRDLLIALMYADCELVIEVFNRLLSSIPYDDFTNAGKQSIRFNNYKFSVQEWHYRSIILAFLRGSGVIVFPEIHTNLGRSDAVVSHKGKTWVIEIKVACEGENPEAKAQEALKQIKEKNYAAPYPDAICVGIAIDDRKRQITNFLSEP